MQDKAKQVLRSFPADLNTLALDNQLCFALYSASLEMTKLYRPLLEPLNLTYPQYLVMMVLWEHNGIPVKKLGAQLHLDSGTLTPLLKRLEKLEYLTRTRNPNDEREVIVTLTPQGSELQQHARKVPTGIACALGLEFDTFSKFLQQVKEVRDRIRAYREAESFNDISS
jgi:DNA-binding MarR family transcriptional regulator